MTSSFCDLLLYKWLIIECTITTSITYSKAIGIEEDIVTLRIEIDCHLNSLAAHGMH